MSDDGDWRMDIPPRPCPDCGPRGATGPPGPGLPLATRRAIIYLVALTLFASGINLFWTAYLVNKQNHAKCGVVETIASLPVPSGQITEGARGFDLELEAAFAKRGQELGCR